MRLTIIAIPDEAAPRQAFRQFLETVAAGFPSPAIGYEDTPLDLNEYCVRAKTATYFVRCEGESMIGAGIFDGDLLVVDKSKAAADGQIVIASVDGEFTVKKLQLRPVPMLLAMNPRYKPIPVEPDGLEIWGVVTYVIHRTDNVPAQ
ncbi:LexA family protein [Pantoea agglomerans]|uniref:LexA family protein n=1 Tax=Enterobacter agglomerans TaxID=549 RepID=UPI003524619D